MEGKNEGPSPKSSKDNFRNHFWEKKMSKDVMEVMDLADTLTRHINNFEEKITARTGKLETRVKELEMGASGPKGR